MKLALTCFPSIRAATGKRYSTTWESFISRPTMVAPPVVAVKENIPGVSLATFTNDHRLDANTERVYAVGLDFDKEVDWDGLVERFDGVDSFTHTTWSSTPVEPRARVFLRLSRPVTGDEYRLVYAAVAARCESEGLVIDRKASNPARFWFLPARAPGGGYSFSIGRGAPVNVDWALSAAPKPAPAPCMPAPIGPVGDVEARAAAYLERCEPAISGSGGHNVTFLTAVRLVKGFALDEATAFRLLCRWNERCSPPWSEAALRRKVRQAIERGSMPDGALRDAPRSAR